MRFPPPPTDSRRLPAQCGSGRHHQRDGRLTPLTLTTLASPVDLAAAVYHLLGVNPRTEIRDRLGRPQTLCEGRVIDEILT